MNNYSDEEESKSPVIVPFNNIGDDNSFDDSGFQDIDDDLNEVQTKLDIKKEEPTNIIKSKKVISIPNI